MTLYETKQAPLTIEELDGNFKELQGSVLTGIAATNIAVADTENIIETCKEYTDNRISLLNTAIQNIQISSENGETITTGYDDSAVVARIETLETQKTDTEYVTNAIAEARARLATEFLLKDFNTTFETPIEIPPVTTDIANTSIANIDVAIDDEMAVEYAIAGMVKYQVIDENGTRLNCFPVCSFSMEGQKILRMRMMCGGTSRVFAKSVKGALLLKRREA